MWFSTMVAATSAASEVSIDAADTTKVVGFAGRRWAFVAGLAAFVAVALAPTLVELATVTWATLATGALATGVFAAAARVFATVVAGEWNSAGAAVGTRGAAATVGFTGDAFFGDSALGAFAATFRATFFAATAFGRATVAARRLAGAAALVRVAFFAAAGFFTRDTFFATFFEVD
jgi:hypothetical protein